MKKTLIRCSPSYPSSSSDRNARSGDRGDMYSIKRSHGINRTDYAEIMRWKISPQNICKETRRFCRHSVIIFARGIYAFYSAGLRDQRFGGIYRDIYISNANEIDSRNELWHKS